MNLIFHDVIDDCAVVEIDKSLIYRNSYDEDVNYMEIIPIQIERKTILCCKIQIRIIDYSNRIPRLSISCTWNKHW